MNVYVIMLGGGKFSTGRNLPALKFSFLPTSHGLESNIQLTLAKRPEGYKASNDPPLPNGRRVIQRFTLHPRQKARGLQSSKPPNLPWSTENSHLPVGVAWLPVSLGSSRPPPSDANFLYTGIPAQSRSLLAPLCAHKPPPPSSRDSRRVTHDPYARLRLVKLLFHVAPSGVSPL